MMNFRRIIIYCSLPFFLSLPVGCALSNPPIVEDRAPESPKEDTLDSSCAYFYFLWGNSAEYDERYEEALEAYEKASICDPEAEYIAEKIPVLLIQLGRLDEATTWLENYIVNRPEKTVQRFMLARLKIHENKEDEAIKLYQEALDVEPENNNIRLRLGLLFGKKGEYDVAEKIFKTILAQNENSYFAVLYLARLHVKTGQLEEAEKRYLEAQRLNWSKELSYEIADFYNLDKQFAKAQKTYTEILRRDERDERASLGLIQTYLFLQDGESALHELERIKQFTGNPKKIDLIRSQILINLGENDRAKEILVNLLKETPLAQANYLLGIVLYEESHLDEAIDILRKIPPSSSEYHDAIKLRVRILEESAQFDKSIELLEVLIASEKTREPSFYSWLASIYQERENIDKARDTLAAGVKIYPADEMLLYEYAILIEKLGHHRQAMELMQKILSLNLNHADALNFIGYSWADRNIKLEKAHEYIEKALDLKPNSGYILDSLGWVYYRLGAFEKAREKLESAVKLEPEDPYIYDHLGDTYRALGNKQQAIHFYQKSQEFFSNAEKIKYIQEKIDSLNAQ